MLCLCGRRASGRLRIDAAAAELYAVQPLADLGSARRRFRARHASPERGSDDTSGRDFVQQAVHLVSDPSGIYCCRAPISAAPPISPARPARPMPASPGTTMSRISFRQFAVRRLDQRRPHRQERSGRAQRDGLQLVVSRIRLARLSPDPQLERDGHDRAYVERRLLRGKPRPHQCGRAPGLSEQAGRGRASAACLADKSSRGHSAYLSASAISSRWIISARPGVPRICGDVARIAPLDALGVDRVIGDRARGRFRRRAGRGSPRNRRARRRPRLRSPPPAAGSCPWRAPWRRRRR